MLTSKDLMIGDWYAFRGHPYKCTASDIASLAECEENGAPTDISEIPLTAEILEKNEWRCFNTYHKYSHPKASFDIRQQKDGGYTIEVDADEYGSAVFLFILHVHQLQHVLRLCGIEKEIEL